MKKTKIELKRDELIKKLENGTYSICTKELSNLVMPISWLKKHSTTLKQLAIKSGLNLKKKMF